MNANYEPTFGVQFHALGGARGDARQSRLLKHAGRHAALMLQRCTQNDLARGVGSASARRLEAVAPCLRERDTPFGEDYLFQQRQLLTG